MLKKSKLVCITHIKVQESDAIKEGAKMLCNKCSFIRKFRRGILFHNIPNNDNKNAKKIKVQIESCFTTNLGGGRNFESCFANVFFVWGLSLCTFHFHHLKKKKTYIHNLQIYKLVNTYQL
jgi:hypothetical protein